MTNEQITMLKDLEARFRKLSEGNTTNSLKDEIIRKLKHEEVLIASVKEYNRTQAQFFVDQIYDALRKFERQYTPIKTEVKCTNVFGSSNAPEERMDTIIRFLENDDDIRTSNIHKVDVGDKRSKSTNINVDMYVPNPMELHGKSSHKHLCQFEAVYECVVNNRATCKRAFKLVSVRLYQDGGDSLDVVSYANDEHWVKENLEGLYLYCINNNLI